MDKYNNEQVLVVNASLIKDHNNKKTLLPYEKEFFQKLLSLNKFMPRTLAEEDTNFKQLIPYCIFTYKGKYLSYARTNAGGEARLHGKRSMGIGGHINPIDQTNTSFDEEAYNAGLHREIHEELNITGKCIISPQGFINDNSNEVGKVHLGVIHLVKLDSPKVSPNEAAIGDLTFHTKEELYAIKDQFENWSQFAINLLP